MRIWSLIKSHVSEEVLDDIETVVSEVFHQVRVRLKLRRWTSSSSALKKA